MKAKPKRSCHDYFDDEVEAARARDRRAWELFGEYAWLNLPPEDPPEQGQ